MDLHITKPGAGYASPTLSEIEKIARHFALPVYHPTLMRDVANLISGGEINSRLIEKSPMLNDEGFRKYVAIINELAQNDLIIAPENIPGMTPLIKAANFIYSDGGQQQAQQAAQGAGGQGQQLQPGQNGKGDHGGKGDKKDGPKDNPPQGEDPGFDNEAEQEAIDDLIDANEIMIRVSNLLDKTPAFELSKRKKLKPNAYGTTVRTRGIEEISELPKLRQIEFASIGTPQGLVRLVTGEAQVREWCFEEVPRKRYYLLTDASGSMNQQQKVSKALGVMFTLMKRVLKNDVIVDFSFFSTHTLGFREIADAETVKKAITYMNTCKWDGGGTNIVQSLEHVFDHMEKVKAETKKKELTVKDIVIITDGEDSATRNLDSSIFRLKHARLHYVEVGAGEVGTNVQNHNPTLRKIALETGGFSATY